MRKYVVLKIKVPTPKVRGQNCVPATTQKLLTKLHRKIEHNEKVCCTQEVGSSTQVQGHGQVRGQSAP